MEYENILVRQQQRVGIVQFNRPQALNALNREMMAEVLDALEQFDADPQVGCLLVTGNERAFAAGADIKEMATAMPADMLNNPFIDYWDRLRRLAKPLVAAVSGFALGGGCEFAMACDMIVASESAQFGQPEINLGVIPGAGGTQRLTRAVGKSKAMDMVLTGRMMDAQEAERSGLVSRIVAAADLMGEAVKVAEKIAGMSRPSVVMAKEAVNRAYETTLAEGVRFERRLFQSLFATEDQKEGMAAFVEKRKASFANR
jgi:enoyl-CoA hydratase